MEYAAPIVFCLVFWWLGTGIVLRLDSLPETSYQWSALFFTAVIIIAMLGMLWLRSLTTLWSAYAAFSIAVVFWGWLEFLHYSGYLVGPRKQRCPTNISTGRRFVYAFHAMLFHELATAAGAAILFVMLWESPNKVALYTYAVLWLMRISAELNVFFGVAYLPEEWLPKRLRYLMSYRGNRRATAFFLLSVAVSMTVCVWLFMQMPERSNDVFGQVSIMLIGSLLALAIIEHWVLVLPIKWFSLWSWAQRRAAL